MNTALRYMLRMNSSFSLSRWDYY